MALMKLILPTLLAIAEYCCASINDFNDGDDLDSFISEPLLRPPIFKTSSIVRSKLTPGYWFLAPYGGLKQAHLTSQLEVCQVGPHIFDNNGNLVWSGACEFHNSNVFDFKAWNDGDFTQLSFILADRHNRRSLHRGRGIGVVLNRHYDRRDVHVSPSDSTYNMHEFSVFDNGKRGLLLTGGTRIVESSNCETSCNNSTSKSVWDGSFIEIDMGTGKPVFEWKFLDHIQLSESSVRTKSDEDTVAFDWNHPNSVDKDSNGDYLVSSRYTDTIYKISRKDGSIIWRLGGSNSSFVLNGFNFTRQHDARFRGQRGTKAWISLLNNAGDDVMSSGTTSAGYLVELDTARWTATLARQWPRPDGGRTRLRGNIQLLPNGHVFASWSENGYITEFDAEGAVVLDASFASHRFVTYRAYKFDFVGRPRHPPAVRALASDIQGGPGAATAVYMSWNGATDIETWKVYGGWTRASTNFSLIGTARKAGFETALSVAVYFPFVYVEAITADGSSLGASNITAAEVPASWSRGRISQLRKGFQEVWAESRQETGNITTSMLPDSDASLSNLPGWEEHSEFYILGIGLFLGAAITSLGSFLFHSLNKSSQGKLRNYKYILLN